ncbi:hypothetical protein JD276_13190 [Leucobacter sp. CSA1]|uniref:Uncharacterized protein n=1 Tax=Leucobacter chromiisoli TaxID=2796471 RepID=A0A934QA54_9MICO|nr:hypothetical protein [Leucobacter chromiisoli]MBK0419986.1 hypothetical protein [Leucobacter chromiisoli]
MAKDKRLFTQIVVDFHRHPKITRLPVEVRWTFIEMLGEARIADNDGVFASEDAEFMWPLAHLEALLGSHPSRPLLVKDDAGCYVIRDYAEHQQTRAEREELARIARENGAKGGRPRKPRGNPAVTQGVSDQNPTEPSETQTKPESESELEIEIERLLTKSVSLDVSRASKTDGPKTNSSARPVDPRRIADLVETVCDTVIDEPAALRLSKWIVDQSPEQVRYPHAYTERAIRNDPLKIQEWIDQEVIT